MTYKLSRQSLAKLGGVHPDLVKVVKRAIELTKVDFGITEGLRSVTRQKELFEQGKSHTMRSRHLTGHAVDIVAYVNGKVSWEDHLYDKIADAFKEAARELGVKIVWGGSFKKLVDKVHFELDKNVYP